MEYTNLGRTGLKVSRLCLGTMNFGPQTDEPDSFAIMDRALDHGINFFDTANVYGWKTARASPSRSSAAGSRRAAAGARRSSWPPRSTARWATGPTSRASPPGTSSGPARTRCGGCRPTTSTSTRCTTSTGARRGRRSGRRWRPWSRRARCSTSARPTSPAGTSPQAQEAAGQRNFLGLVSEQCIYNLLTRHVELEVLPAAQHYGLGIIPWSPLHGGLLVRRAAQEGRGQRRRAARAAARPTALAEHRGRRSRRTRSSAPTLGHDPADVALAWLLSRPGRDRADRRPAHHGAARRTLGALDVTWTRPAGPPRRAVPAGRQRRPGPGGLGLVGGRPRLTPQVDDGRLLTPCDAGRPRRRASASGHPASRLYRAYSPGGCGPAPAPRPTTVARYPSRASRSAATSASATRSPGRAMVRCARTASRRTQPASRSPARTSRARTPSASTSPRTSAQSTVDRPSPKLPPPPGATPGNEPTGRPRRAPTSRRGAGRPAPRRGRPA